MDTDEKASQRLVVTLTGADAPPIEVEGVPVLEGSWEKLAIELHVPAGYTRASVKVKSA